MPPRKKQPICEIVFGQLRIPVSDSEQGKRVIEGIFMIGETGKAEGKPRGRRRGKKRGRKAKVTVKPKIARRAKRIKRVVKPEKKGRKVGRVAKKVPRVAGPMVSDLKEEKKE